MLGGPLSRRLTPASGKRGVEGCGHGNAAMGGGELVHAARGWPRCGRAFARECRPARAAGYRPAWCRVPTGSKACVRPAA